MPLSKNTKPILTEPEVEELAQELLGQPFKKLSPRKKRILHYIAEGELVSVDPNKTYTEQLTLGQIFADKVARFGGSWPFILSALLILTAWILINAIPFVLDTPFDPYPFILLNLGLSMLAALQAPIIMMSQNRRAEKDRIDANSNYEVSLKMELDVTRLHQRIDDIEELIKGKTNDS